MKAELEWIDGDPHLSVYDNAGTYLGMLSVEQDEDELVFTINTRKDRKQQIIETIGPDICLT